MTIHACLAGGPAGDKVRLVCMGIAGEIGEVLAELTPGAADQLALALWVAADAARQLALPAISTQREE